MKDDLHDMCPLLEQNERLMAESQKCSLYLEKSQVSY